ncbi:MAG: phosphopantetheine-binding protein [Butyrivibrio sp.]|nr:phosphopantetheine-binding protein [Butyrivibrio sp.]
MIFNKLLEIFSNVIPEVDQSEISKDSTLLEDLGLNSLTMMLLAVSIEDEYGVSFDADAKLDTVQDVIDFISAKTGLE